jgi:hypothetical protein
MTCKLTMTLISESQEGNIGEDWKYDLHVKAFIGALKGEGKISVPKHNLPPGTIREPHGAPGPVVVYTGDCDGELLLRMHLVATEVDMFVNDVGKADKELRFACPGPARQTITKEVDIPVDVREMPAILPQRAVFTLRVRFTLSCE